MFPNLGIRTPKVFAFYVVAKPHANDLYPLPQDAVLAEQLQTSPVSDLGFSHHAQRTKAIPEGAGKRIRAQRAGTAPTKPAEARPESDDEHYSSN